MDLSGTAEYGLNNLASVILRTTTNSKSYWLPECFGACIIDGFDINWFTNLKQA